MAESGFSSAGRPYQSNGFARVDVHGQIPDHHMPGVLILGGFILETHMVKVDGTFDVF